MTFEKVPLSAIPQRKSVNREMEDALRSLAPGEALKITVPPEQSLLSKRAALFFEAKRNGIKVTINTRDRDLYVFLRTKE